MGDSKAATRSTLEMEEVGLREGDGDGEDRRVVVME